MHANQPVLARHALLLLSSVPVERLTMVLGLVASPEAGGQPAIARILSAVIAPPRIESYYVLLIITQHRPT